MTTEQSTDSVLNYADMKRQSISKTLLKKQKLEQYFSSAPLAHLMASMMDYPQREIRILDPGAGIGSLFVACVDEICKREQPPRKIAVTAYEVDSILFDSLNDSLERVRDLCHRRGVEFSGNLERKDFIEDYSSGDAPNGFTHVINESPVQEDQRVVADVRGAAWCRPTDYKHVRSIHRHIPQHARRRRADSLHLA